MKLSAIRTEEEYEAALNAVERLFEIEDNALEQEQWEILLDLVKAYEDKHYSIPQPNMASKILYHLESRGFLHR